MTPIIRHRAARILALMVAILVPAALATTPAPASSLSFSYVDCDPLWSPMWNIDDTSPLVAYTGSWKKETPNAGQFQGTQHITNVGGSKASYALRTTPYQFAIGFTAMRNSGIAAVYHDNQLVTEVDMYSPITDYNCALVFDGYAPPGTYTVKALNRRNPRSGGTYVNVDYFHHNT